MINRRELFKRFMATSIGMMASSKRILGNTLDPLFWDDEEDYVILYDTYAMALYMDGSLGPKTGIIKVDYILENEPITFSFWHGHSGKSHEFTLLPEHFDKLKMEQKVVLETTEVEGHQHRLFIDPTQPKWRVPGALPIKVPKKDA